MSESESKPENDPDRVGYLVQEACAGGRAAFNQLIDRFQPDIFRMIFYRTQSQMDAEDITQDVFLQAYQHISTLKTPERFRGWLYRIALNRIRDFYRRKRLRSLFRILPERPEVNDIDNSLFQPPEAETRLNRMDFWNAVQAMLKKLSKSESEVFLLRFMDHLGIREIAQVLNKSESTVKTLLYRSLGKFKKDRSLRVLLKETVS